MSKKKWILPASIVGGLIALAVIAVAVGWAVMVARGFSLSTGRAMVTADGKVLLVAGETPVELTAEPDVLPTLSTGDRIAVVHDGVEESYPARTAAYWCVKLGGGSEDDLPADVLASLRELGWTPQTSQKKTDVVWHAVRTNGYHEDQTYPFVTVIRSADELRDYYDANKTLWSFDAGYDEWESFQTVAGRYGAGYFADRVLLLVRLEEPSGSIRHTVTGLILNGANGVTIPIERTVPGICTDDMAEWHLFIEPPAGWRIEPEDRLTDGVSVVFTESVPEKRVVCSQNGVTLSLPRRDGWEYEDAVYNLPADDDRAVTGIRFWPAGHPDGALVLQYAEAWGICGTELEQKQTAVAGRDARLCYYDGSPCWSFLIFADALPDGTVAVISESADGWWDEYGDEAMAILDGVQIDG